MDSERMLKYLDSQIEMLLETLQDKKTSLFGKAEIGAIIAEHLLERKKLVDGMNKKDIQKDMEMFNKHTSNKPYFTNNTTITKEELVELTKDSEKSGNNLKQYMAGQIDKYSIYTPLMERGFLVHLPKSLNITESSIIKCECDNLSKSLELEIRNNVLEKPLVTLANGEYLTSNDGIIGDVVVEILDATGVTIYEIRYKDCKIDYFTLPKLNYDSDEVQKFKLMISFKKYEIV